MYRFHYQPNYSEPRVWPHTWHMNEHRPHFVAIAYIEAPDLASAYTQMSEAVTWWNTQTPEEVSPLDDAAFQAPSQVRFFQRSSVLLLPAETDPLTGKPRRARKRKQIRQPQPGDVFELVEGYGYMLDHLPPDPALPLPWLWLPPGRVIPHITSEQKGTDTNNEYHS